MVRKHCPMLHWCLSNELNILWGNKKASQLLGVRWPGDVGQRIDNLIRFPEFSKYLE